MSENDLVVPKTIEEVRALAKDVLMSSFVAHIVAPGQKEVGLANIISTLLAGRELGFAPMRSLRAFHVIEGKPALAADAMVGIVKASPVCEFFQLKTSTPTIATYATKRRGEPSATEMSFTIEQAKAAGVTFMTQAGKPANWTKYPDAMLRARASSALCRAVYPDLLFGLLDPDEVTPSEDKQPKHERDLNERPRLVASSEALEIAKQKRVSVDVVMPVNPSPPENKPELRDGRTTKQRIEGSSAPDAGKRFGVWCKAMGIGKVSHAHVDEFLSEIVPDAPGIEPAEKQEETKKKMLIVEHQHPSEPGAEG